MTIDILDTYTKCNPSFRVVDKLPQRVLTNPSEGFANNGADNEEANLICRVHDQITCSHTCYTILDLLGTGTFGQVFRCQKDGTKEVVAIKIIKNNYLYASSNDDVFRYKLNEKGEVISPDKPEKIVEGLVNHNRDNSKSIAVDDNNNLYVNCGSYSNSCLVNGSSLKGPMPCPLLDSVGGIWKFKTNKLNQGYNQGVRYATGFKNVVGLDWNRNTQSLFIMQHGRDQFHDLYPQFYTAEEANSQPAETMYEVHKGSDGGWPYVYYDAKLHKKMLAPEYGGDGVRESGETAQDPVADFPAHLGPNGLLFYTGKQFPAKYLNGAFIAFHAKSPVLQKGYLVAFVPFKKNKPAGEWEIFADHFAADPADQPKPCGLAQGPDGSIYVADDAKGNIYQVKYKL